MKKLCLASFCMIVFACSVVSQQQVPASLSKGLIPSTYNRNALTVIVLDNGCNYLSDIKQASATVVIPEKYDDNTLATKVLKSGSDATEILSVINQSNLGNQILSTWFSRSSEGDFNMTLIAERGLYNATADDMIRASASKIGMDKIKDAGKALVDNSYIQVIEFKNVISMKEYYDLQDDANLKYAKQNNTVYKPVDRTRNGWKGSCVSYLFKIDPAYMEVLFNEMWIYSDDSRAVRAEKKALFDKTKFNFSFVMSVTADAEGTQSNPNALTGLPVQLKREELFTKLVNSGVVHSLYAFETKYEPFKVKTSVFAVRPVQAKIGTKEGLGTDQRFFVLENTMNSKGEIEAKRQGVVFVKKVANNAVVATSVNVPMSRFYQTAGKRLEPGMTMQQRNDFGLGLSMGAGGGMGGFYMKAEENLATLSRMVTGISDVIKITQLKLFGSIAFDAAEYSAYSAGFMRYQIGISKGFYFMRNLSVAPFIAYGSESATLSSYPEGTTVNGDFINIGGYFTMNILYNLQLVLTLNTYNLLGEAYETTADDEIYTYANPYDYYFTGRSGANIEIGIRYEL